MIWEKIHLPFFFSLQLKDFKENSLLGVTLKTLKNNGVRLKKLWIMEVWLKLDIETIKIRYRNYKNLQNELA